MKHPYRTTNSYLQQRYGRKIRKICVDGHFTCPNRDGTVGVGGCAFCGERGAGEQLDAALSVRRQVERALAKAPPDSEWIVYFQNFTGTYAPVETLRARYDAALSDSRIRILDIGTRPDCIDRERAALLAEYARDYEVWVELGLQTANDETARKFNRGYDFACFERACSLLREYHLPFIVHMILGLPGETFEDILRTTRAVNDSGAAGVKIHSLYVMKNTALAREYERGDFTPVSMPVYIEWAARVIANLRPDMIVHRVTGNCPREYLLAPDWVLRRDAVIVGIDRFLLNGGLSQGCLYGKGATYDGDALPRRDI